MTDDEREEGARAIAAVMIGNGVAWDTLSEQVRERCKRAYDAAGQVYARAPNDATFNAEPRHAQERGRCRECKRPVRFGQALCERCRVLRARRVG